MNSGMRAFYAWVNTDSVVVPALRQNEEIVEHRTVLRAVQRHGQIWCARKWRLPREL